MSENNNPAPQYSMEELIGSLRKAARKIAPVWPLENFVAVNPFLGMADKSFDTVAQELAAAGGVQMALPLSFYLQKIEEGEITPTHIAEALRKKRSELELEAFVDQLNKSDLSDQEMPRIPAVTDLAAKLTGKDWKRFVTTRISAWASSYFDKGQATWNAAHREERPFLAWKKEAEQDLVPEITGLRGFRKQVSQLPEHPIKAAQEALKTLKISKEGQDLYLHSLLLRNGGWSAYAARIDWDNELYGGKDGILIEFLAILLCWEACLLKCTKHPKLASEWQQAIASIPAIREEASYHQQLQQKLILQEAFDIAVQSKLIGKFSGSELSERAGDQAKAQAVFCIDVRSEVFRRNLELVDNQIETMGFAGFFAFPISYVPLGQQEGEAQCPVLLKTGPVIKEELSNPDETALALQGRILRRQAQQVWKSFKSGAITCFSFVSPMGLSFLPKLFTDSLGWTRPVAHPDEAGLSRKQRLSKQVSLNVEAHSGQTSGIPLDQQIAMARNALTAMSLKDNFGRFVLITGHGSSTVNNPHATGYDCGACGGHTGEANARVAVAVLNNREVRAGLQKEGIFIPVNTIFLACLHDTTTDEVSIYNEYEVPADRRAELDDLKSSLRLAGNAARAERALRLNPEDQANIHKSIFMRSKDWSQTRPEWGLAGCSAFVVAPRERTRGIDFGGRSFLHSYDWKEDKGYGVLELIMTAPMVVTSWISLQYYASTVDNRVFGSGNKTLHNVTAGLGVLEGFSGDLRVGLPWQAVHDGENFQHDPVKLNVIIEAPMEAMSDILARHQSVRNLCDNGWLNLLAMNEEGRVSHRYSGNLQWEEIID